MKKVVSILGLLQVENKDELRKHILWLPELNPTFIGYQVLPHDPNSLSRYRRNQMRDSIVSAKQDPDLFESFKDRDPAPPATYYLTRLIEEGLATREIGGTRYCSMSRVMGWDIRKKIPESKIRPDSLLGAIWLQVANAIETKVSFKTCKSCGAMFGLSPTENRRSREHCSNACKTSACRQRELDARKMHANGNNIDFIVQKLGSTSHEVVEKWLTKDKK